MLVFYVVFVVGHRSAIFQHIVTTELFGDFYANRWSDTVLLPCVYSITEYFRANQPVLRSWSLYPRVVTLGLRCDGWSTFGKQMDWGVSNRLLQLDRGYAATTTLQLPILPFTRGL